MDVPPEREDSSGIDAPVNGHAQEGAEDNRDGCLNPGRCSAILPAVNCATLCYMAKRGKRVGVRELRQNLSVYLRRIGDGETLEVTDHGRAVAILAPLPSPLKPMERLAAQGKVILAKHDVLSLGLPSGKVSRVREPCTGGSSRRSFVSSRALCIWIPPQSLSLLFANPRLLH